MKRVAIVGAGVVGLFCALRLAKAGARVTLLEAESDDLSPYGPAASAAAAGMLAPFDAEGGSHEGLALRSLELWRETAAMPSLAAAVRFNGAVVSYANEQDAAAFQARVLVAECSVVALTPSQAQKRSGLDARWEHALFVPDEGVADPIAVLHGLAAEARTHGVTLLYRHEVAHVNAREVRTHEGETVVVDAVILAPGAWATDALVAAAPALRHVTPAKGHLADVALDRQLGANVHANGVYLAPRSGGAVLGSTLQPGRYDRSLDRDEVMGLLEKAKAFAPRAVKPTGKAWAGIRPMSPDGWPMVGRSGDVLVAAGHSRQGWLLAPITAEIITAYVLNEVISPAWAAWSPQRFESA